VLNTQDCGDISDADNPASRSRHVHEATLLVCDDVLQNCAE
jgi:hypothetical protein